MIFQLPVGFAETRLESMAVHGIFYHFFLFFPTQKYCAVSHNSGTSSTGRPSQLRQVLGRLREVPGVCFSTAAEVRRIFFGHGKAMVI